MVLLSTKHLSLIVLFFCWVVVSNLSSPDNWTRKKRRPLIVAHRGGSGAFPENTVAAYKQAIKDHADYIECDVLPTKDHQLICLHEPYLSTVTDVQQHPEFADRKRKMFIPDYGEFDDWFCFDFTLEELKTLRVRQRELFRDQSYNGLFEIPTFDEFVEVAKQATEKVGLYTEIKLPEFLNEQPFLNGTRFEDLYLDALKRHGYNKKDDPCFVQSFSDSALGYMKNKTDLRLIMSVWLDEQISGPHLNESKIKEWSTLYDGFCAWKTQIVQYYDDVNGFKNWITKETGLLQEVLNTGMTLHLFTFSNEDQFLAWDFKQDPINEYLYFDQLGDIEAFLTDFPATMYRAFEERDRTESCQWLPGVFDCPLLAMALIVLIFFVERIFPMRTQ